MNSSSHGKTFEVDDKYEEEIPDLPENAAAIEFLKKAPSKGLFSAIICLFSLPTTYVTLSFFVCLGLWMPLGKEVKVMQCWRCKAYGHRTNDRECPLNQQGNIVIDAERQSREDPMSSFVTGRRTEREEKYARVEELKRVMDGIREEERERKRMKKARKEARKEKRKRKEKEAKKRKKDS